MSAPPPVTSHCRVIDRRAGGGGKITPTSCQQLPLCPSLLPPGARCHRVSHLPVPGLQDSRAPGLPGLPEEPGH